MTTLLDQYRAAAQAGGGEAWVEELLIRGRPGGGISGAHLIVGWNAQGVGAKVGGVTPPQPLTIAADDANWQQVCQMLNAAALDDLAATREELVSATEQRDAAQSQVPQLVAQLADAQAELAALKGGGA